VPFTSLCGKDGTKGGDELDLHDHRSGVMSSSGTVGAGRMGMTFPSIQAGRVFIHGAPEAGQAVYGRRLSDGGDATPSPAARVGRAELR
jgi:hypothetical protein